MSRSRAWLGSRVRVLMAVWCGAGCLYACDARAPTCHFGVEHASFRSTALTFHDLGLVETLDGVLALFSDAEGLHAQPLDRRGVPRAAPRRLFEACDAGFDAKSLGQGRLLLACSRRARADEPAAGEVTLYTLDHALQVRSSERLGPVGRASHGIALAITAQQRAVIWHDAAVGGGHVWYAELQPGAVARQLADEGWEASAPGLTWASGRLYAMWSETNLAGGPPASRIMLSDPRGHTAAHVVVQSRDPTPSPRFVASQNGLILAFRDKRESARKTGLYLARLDTNGRLAGAVMRAGRADGESAPVLEACLGGVVSATPRTFAGDYFVGVMWADGELRRFTQEQQFYEDSREFDRVAMHCGGAEALLLIGERGRLLRSGAALRSTTFHCR